MTIIFLWVNIQTNKHILSVFSIITPNYVKVPLCKQEAERCHDLQWGFSLLASIAAGHCTPSCSLTVKVNLQVSRITSHAGWAFHLPFGVFAQSGASGSFTQTTATHVGWRSTKHWPPLTALITCWQYKQFRTQLWLDRQDGVNEPYYTDYLTSVQWVMWSYFTLACLKHTSCVSPGMFAFQLQPRITSQQLGSDKNRCVIIALWAVSKVMQWHSCWEMFAELGVEELPVFAYRRCA